MAPSFRFTPLAISDLESIWNFIAQDNEDAADRVEGAIFDACNRLGRNPNLGSRRPHLRISERVRIWSVPRFPNYQIVYYADTTPLQVIAILHGKRNLRRVLRTRETE